MAKSGTEEKSPLLFVVDSNDDILKAKQKLYFENGRFQSITNGATAVFTNLPDVVGTCWITTALCGLLFFMMLMLIMSSVANNNIRVPRCIPTDELNNKTIHLVHADPTNHWQPSEIDIIDKIIKNYPDYKIHLILIQRASSWMELPKSNNDIRGTQSSSTKEESINSSEIPKGTEITSPKKDLITSRKKRKTEEMHLSINAEARRLLDMILHGARIVENSKTVSKNFHTVTTSALTETTTVKPITTVKDLLEVYPHIMVENASFNQVFFQSPLYAYWHTLNDELRVFAIRVLQLWQYGGMSFDLNPTIKNVEVKNDTDDSDKDYKIFNKKLMKFIISEHANYKGLSVGVVAADDEGLHMESKVPCHAFFGQILINLRHAQTNTTVKDVLRASIRVFCGHFSVNKEYCNTIMKTQ